MTRVIVLKGNDPDNPLVVDISAIYQHPAALSKFNKSYTLSLQFWGWAGGMIVLAGIVASLVWHWWAFILGFLINFLLTKANRQSAAQFTVESLTNHPGSPAYFSSLGLIWHARSEGREKGHSVVISDSSDIAPTLDETVDG